MIDLKLVQKDPQILADALKNRHSSINIEEFRELDQKRRSILAEVEALKSERNQASAKIAAMKKRKDFLPTWAGFRTGFTIWTSRPRKQGRLWKTGWLPFPTFPMQACRLARTKAKM